jgi:hypothetical protein
MPLLREAATQGEAELPAVFTRKFRGHARPPYA